MTCPLIRWDTSTNGLIKKKKLDVLKKKEDSIELRLPRKVSKSTFSSIEDLIPNYPKFKGLVYVLAFEFQIERTQRNPASIIP